MASPMPIIARCRGRTSMFSQLNRSYPADIEVARKGILALGLSILTNMVSKVTRVLLKYS